MFIAWKMFKKSPGLSIFRPIESFCGHNFLQTQFQDLKHVKIDSMLCFGLEKKEILFFNSLTIDFQHATLAQVSRQR